MNERTEYTPENALSFFGEKPELLCIIGKREGESEESFVFRYGELEGQNATFVDNTEIEGMGIVDDA